MTKALQNLYFTIWSLAKSSFALASISTLIVFLTFFNSDRRSLSGLASWCVSVLSGSGLASWWISVLSVSGLNSWCVSVLSVCWWFCACVDVDLNTSVWSNNNWSFYLWLFFNRNWWRDWPVGSCWIIRTTRISNTLSHSVVWWPVFSRFNFLSFCNRNLLCWCERVLRLLVTIT